MENAVGEWVIRPAKAADRRAVGRVMAEAFADIYTPVVGNDLELAAAIAGAFPPEIACYVGERAGEVCGAAFLTFSPLQGGLGFTEERAIWRVLRERQSFSRALLSRILLSLPAAANKADRVTSYLSSLSVRPAWQGHGLGTAILETLEDVSRQAGKTRIALHVTDTNWKARQLYDRRGFREVRMEPAFFTRRIWGFRGLVYMIKYLTEPQPDREP